MGVDTRVYLPPTVRLNRVAIAIGALHGLLLVKSPARNREDMSEQFYIDCPSVRVESSVVPEMVKLTFMTKFGEHRAIFFHFEADGGPPSGGGAAAHRLIIMRSTARNIAVAKKLVDVFGGRIVYQDCSNATFSKPNYKRPENRLNAANDGGPYFQMVRTLAAIQPLTHAQIAVCKKHAAYDYDPEGTDRGYDMPILEAAHA